MGLAPLIGRGRFAVIKKLNKSGTIILLGEQNAKAALNVAKRDFVLETEANVLEGLATDLFDDPKVQEAYLGD